MEGNMSYLDKSESSSESAVNEFSKNLDELQDELAKALDDSEKTKSDADKFSESSFSRIFGVLTGRNDKDLAAMISNLGVSLQTTQRILRFILQINSESNKSLLVFHAKLMNMIDELKSNEDIHDLNLRENLTDFLEYLKVQVEEKLEQKRIIEKHSIAVENVENAIAALQKEQYGIVEKILEVEKRAGSLSHQMNIVHEELTQLSSKIEIISLEVYKKRIGFRDVFQALIGICVLALLYFNFFHLRI